MKRKLLLILASSLLIGWILWYGLSVYQNNKNNKNVVFDTQSLSNIFNCNTQSVKSNIRYGDCIWLISLYYSTDWYNRTNNVNHNNEWLIWSNPCSWYGVTCEYRRVVKIDLPSNNLASELSPNIRLMTNLRYLNLSNNELCKIPESIIYFNHLVDNVWLDISHNNLDISQYSSNFTNWMQNKWFEFGIQNSQGCNMINVNNNPSNSASSSTSSNGWSNSNTTTVINANWNNNSSNQNNAVVTNPNNPNIGTNSNNNSNNNTSCDSYCYFGWVDQYHKFNCSNISTITIPWITATSVSNYNWAISTSQNITIDHGNNMEWMFTLPSQWTYNFTISYNNNVLCNKTIIY